MKSDFGIFSDKDSPVERSLFHSLCSMLTMAALCTTAEFPGYWQGNLHYAMHFAICGIDLGLEAFDSRHRDRCV